MNVTEIQVSIHVKKLRCLTLYHCLHCYKLVIILVLAGTVFFKGSVSQTSPQIPLTRFQISFHRWKHQKASLLPDQSTQFCLEVWKTWQLLRTRDWEHCFVGIRGRKLAMCVKTSPTNHLSLSNGYYFDIFLKLLLTLKRGHSLSYKGFCNLCLPAL